MFLNSRLRLSNKHIDSTEKSAIINMVLKPISAVLSFVYTPMLLSYLGDEKYGLWATVLSIITWINFFDVGIGNGLRNLLTKILAEKDEKEAQKAVSTAYIMLSVIAIALLIALTLITLWVNWEHVFSTSIPMKSVMWITFAFICVNFVLALSNTLLYALHLAEKVSIRNCLVQLANIIGLFIISKYSQGSLVAMAILFGGTSTILYLANSIQVFKNNQYLVPSLRKFDKSKINDICNIGMKFFVIQIMGLLLFTVDNMLITHYFGPQAATPFSIADKVFNTIYSIFAAFIVPYWSKTTVAIAQNNITWIKKSIEKVAFVGFAFICGYIVVGLFFRPLVNLWLQKNLDFDNGLILVMVLFYVAYTILGVECQFINGIGKINTQLIVYIIIGILNIPLSIILGIGCNMGSVGIRLATTILVIFAVSVLAINLNKIIGDSEVKKKQAD